MEIKLENNYEDKELDNFKKEIEDSLNKCNELNEPQKSINKTILNGFKLILNNYKPNIPNVSQKAFYEENNPPHIQKLSKLTDIDINKLEQIFNFKEDDFEFMNPIIGEKSIDKQVKATLIILTIYYITYEKDEIPSKELGKHLRWLGTGAYSHISENIRNECNDLIEIKGTAPNLSYKINLNGIQEGKKMIIELLDGKIS